MNDNGRYVTIQQTSKRWKLLWLVGVCMTFGGLFVPEVGLEIAILGILMAVIAKIGRWWTND
jgi:hypothetical protein